MIGTLKVHASNLEGQANDISEEDLDHENDDESDPTSTPPQTPIKVKGVADRVLKGRVTKRISPRKNEKKDYKQMGDPFVGMKDENGEHMFEDKGASSEDSDPTDTEFGQEPRRKSTFEAVKYEDCYLKSLRTSFA